jgi:hypothetical protein
MTQIEREYDFFSDPDMINKICLFISEGGSLIDIAALHRIRYTTIKKWIEQDALKLDLYNKALDDRKEWARERILKEIKELSYFDIRKVLNDDGSVMAPKDWPDEVAKAIVGMDVADLFEGKGQEKIQTGILKKIKFIDKIKAIEMQAKNLKLLTEQVEHTGKVTLDDLIMATQQSEDASSRK